MTTLSEIKYSQLVDRFDSIYYRPEYLEKLRKLTRKSNNHFHVRMFSEITESIRKGIFYILKEEYKEIGIPFIRVSNIGQFFLSDENLTFISEEKNKDNSKTSLIENDIVISKSGTIGNAAIITKDFSPCNISQDVIGIKLKEQIEPSFIITFLNSVFGHFQIKRNAGQALQGHLDLDALRNILIPIPPKPFQDKIEKLVKEAFSKRKLADQKYNQAKQFLEEELGLDKLKLKEEKTFEAKSSELFESGRFDVGFNKPKYSKINEFFEKNEKEKIFIVKRLKEVSKLFKGIEIGSNAYTNEGYLFFRVSNISEREITIGTSSQFVRPYLYEQLKSKYKPEIGDVLYTKDATIGISFVVDKDFHEFILSGGVVRIKPKDVNPYYLGLILNSIICKSQSERQSIGAVIKHFTFGNVKNLKIPVLPKPKQEKISELVRESFSFRKESKKLLEESKKIVETAIENGT